MSFRTERSEREKTHYGGTERDWWDFSVAALLRNDMGGAALLRMNIVEAALLRMDNVGALNLGNVISNRTK